jgi:hypothetical protein
MNKVLTIAIMMFFGSTACFAGGFEEKFWISCFETFGVLLVPLVGITVAGLIIRAFGFAGACFVFVAYIILTVIWCVGLEGCKATGL